MLTARQREALQYIERHLERSGGVSPTIREIARGIGSASSYGHVYTLVRGLEERGFIRRLPNRVRAIEVIRKAPIAGFKIFQFNNSTKEFEPHSYIPPRMQKPAIGPG